MPGFMGVIGAVDYTHILLVSLVAVPSNRKEYFSLNMQAISTVSE